MPAARKKKAKRTSPAKKKAGAAKAKTARKETTASKKSRSEKKKTGAGRRSIADLERKPLGALYRWYAKHKRDLPFRATTDFYPVWVSEIMLQQTRVAAMLPLYEEFMRRFPTVRALADSREDEVLSAWRGLGYYSRARNLRAGAIQVVNEYGGEFPRDERSALGIKGVGEYTAAAILSIALDQDLAVYDGNVRRVLSRLYHPRAGTDDDSLKALAAGLIRGRGRTSPGEHNQAMMELGALICVPGLPDCSRCPLRLECDGLAHVGPGPAGGAELAKIPPSKKDLRQIELELRVFYVFEARTETIWVLRDPASRFFKRLWFFPVRYRVLSRNEPAARRKKSARAGGKGTVEFPDSPGLSLLLEGKSAARAIRARRQVGEFRHGITHHKIRGVVEILEVDDARELLWKELIAATETGIHEWRKIPADEIESNVVSSIARKILPQVRPAQPELFS